MLSGVDEVKVTVAGVTLLLPTVNGTTSFCVFANCMAGAGRREFTCFCAHASPLGSRVAPASINIINLRIPASFPYPRYVALMV